MLWIAALAAAPPSEAAAPGAPETRALERCLERVLGTGEQSQLHAPFRLRTQCPEVADRRGQAFERLLGRPLPDELSIAQLLDLRSFQEGLGARASGPTAAPDPTAAGPILAVTLVVESETLSWWDRFRRWLRSWFSGPSQEGPDWIAEFLDAIEVPSWLAESLLRVLLVLLVVAALAIILNETRAAGLLRRRPRARGAPPTAVARGGIQSPAGQAPAGPRQQVGAVLTLTLCGLADRGLLSATPSRTNRELLQELRQTGPVLYPHLAALVETAEPVLYGDLPADQRTLQRLETLSEAVLRGVLEPMGEPV